MVNTPKDEGFTKKHLSDVLLDYSTIENNEKKKTIVQLVDMEIGYTWTNALNYAMMVALTENACSSTSKFQFILNISVETILNQSNLDKMINSFQESPTIVVVGTTFKPIYPKEIEQTLTQQQKVTELGKTYKNPRNTCMLIRMSALQNCGGGLSLFDAWCDNINGMEDFYFLIQMLILNPFAEFRIPDLKVELLIGINFNQKEKQEREMKAIDLILERFRTLKNSNTSNRIEWAISKVLANIKD